MNCSLTWDKATSGPDKRFRIGLIFPTRLSLAQAFIEVLPKYLSNATSTLVVFHQSLRKQST